MDTLSFHGKTVEQCEWVLMNYAGRDDYTNNNGSVQQWVKDSHEFLEAHREDVKWDQAVESKFGKDV